jgi:hypothetical protein
MVGFDINDLGEATIALLEATTIEAGFAVHTHPTLAEAIKEAASPSTARPSTSPAAAWAPSPNKEPPPGDDPNQTHGQAEARRGTTRPLPLPDDAHPPVRRKMRRALHQGKIKGFLHLYTGQEACAVGAINALEEQDKIVTHYRDHGHALAKGVDPNRIMAELYGRQDGVSGGRGGSMHLYDVAKGFLGGYAIVTAHLPLAVGLGLASQMKKQNFVTMCVFGDGSVGEGEFHEAPQHVRPWKAHHLLSKTTSTAWVCPSRNRCPPRSRSWLPPTTCPRSPSMAWMSSLSMKPLPKGRRPRLRRQRPLLHRGQ